MSKEEKEKYRKEMIEKFRAMWNWIADETEKRKIKVIKREYFDENNIPILERPLADCYLCEYTYNGYAIDEDERCFICPVIWSEQKDKDSCTSGLYAEWSYIPIWDWEKAANLARQIANLPERKEE